MQGAGDTGWPPTVQTGEGSSGGMETQTWANAWGSSEEWNRWHLECAAAWTHQSYVRPKHVPMIAPPIPKYRGKAGQKKGEKAGKGKEQKLEKDGDLLDNVRKALEMWRIMENANEKGPTKNQEEFYGKRSRS